MSLVIAIDGPAGSGKGTLARKLAAHYKLPYLDTGLLYRAVAWKLLKNGSDLEDRRAAAAIAAKLDLNLLPEAELRAAPRGEGASIVAAYPEVRQALLDLQRAFASRPEGAVLDGRDIGTVICPEADVKLYVTATAQVRAQRRLKEAQARGEATDFEVFLADICRRDARDSGRKAAPLRQAEDALLLETSKLDIDEAFQAAIHLIDTTVARKERKRR